MSKEDDLREAIKRAEAMLPGRGGLRALAQGKTRRRRKERVALEMAKYILANQRFQITGPSCRQIADEFGMSSRTPYSGYLAKEKPLHSVFRNDRKRGVVPRFSVKALEYIKHISPATTVLGWTADELNELIGPDGLINSYFLSANEVKEAIEKYARDKYQL